MSQGQRRFISVLCAAALAAPLTFPREALAQPASTEPRSAETSLPKMEEAKERFTRGLKLYQDGNYEAARVEFERAYALAPSYKLLYNVGYCYRQLNDYVAAIRALDQFVAEGGTEIPEARREEVQKTLVDLRSRIAAVVISTNVDGATITIDDVVVGVSPLREPVLVNPGRRRITATQKGGPQVTQAITAAGREQLRVNLELEGPRTIVVEKKGTNFAPYVAWGVTGALGIGTLVSGIVALNAASKQDDLLTTFGGNAQTQKAALDDARSDTVAFGTLTDVLLVSTIAAAGVATYLTITTWNRDKEPAKQQARRELRAGVAGPGVVFSGQF
jgi:hypothetical protein